MNDIVGVNCNEKLLLQVKGSETDTYDIAGQPQYL